MTDPNNEKPESTDSEQELSNASDQAPSEIKNNQNQALADPLPEVPTAGAIEAQNDVAPKAQDKTEDGGKDTKTSTQAPDSAPTPAPKRRIEKRKNKKLKAKSKPKKETERKTVVSEKFSRSDSRGFQLTPDGLLRHFLACRVCCYFLSGVQVLYGRDVVNRMVSEFDGTWMYVPLTRETRTLLQKTYGVQVDTGDFFIEHACEVCCRRFVIDLPEPVDFVTEDEDISDATLEELERREPVIFEPARTREDREPDWGRDRPMLLVEFKHRR